jgi:hypothetical protein
VRDAFVAFLAALLSSALEAVGRFAWNGPYLPELMAEKLFGVMPVWSFTPLFRTFGYHSKYYAFGGMIAAEIAGLTLLGMALRQWMRRRRRLRWKTAWLAAAVAGTLAVVILVGLLPLLDAGLAGRTLDGGVSAAAPSVVGVAGCYASVLAWGASP